MGTLDLDSVSSCLPIYVKQQNAFRAISLINKVEMNIISLYFFMGFGKYVDTDICYVFGTLRRMYLVL